MAGHAAFSRVGAGRLGAPGWRGAAGRTWRRAGMAAGCRRHPARGSVGSARISSATSAALRLAVATTHSRDLLLQHLLAQLLAALLEARHRRGAALLHLDDVPAEGALHRLG